MLFREIVNIKTKKGISFEDITDRISSVVGECAIQDGLCNIYLTATTAGLMINEDERMLLEDFRLFFEHLASEKKLYLHPSNAFSHLRANLLDASKTIPVSGGRLVLGTWQRIILWEFDAQERDREIIITITGE